MDFREVVVGGTGRKDKNGEVELNMKENVNRIRNEGENTAGERMYSKGGRKGVTPVEGKEKDKRDQVRA